jgi:hypothetical protein
MVADASGVKKGVDEAKKALGSLPASARDAMRAASSSFDTAAQQMAGRLGAVGDAASALGPHALAAAAGIGAITAAMTAAVSAAVDYSGRIQDLADQTGMSAEALQRLDYAAKLTGTTLDQFVNASMRLSKTLEDSPAKLEALGLSVQRLKAMSPDRQFEAVAEAIRGLQTSTQQAAAAMDIFGKGAGVILPAIRQGLGGLGDEAERVGAVMTNRLLASSDKLGEEADRLSKAWDTVVLSFGAFLVDGLKLDQVVGMIAQSVGRLTGELNKLANSGAADVLTGMMLRSPVFGVTGVFGGLAALAKGDGHSLKKDRVMTGPEVPYFEEIVVDGTDALRKLERETEKAAAEAKKLAEAHKMLAVIGQGPLAATMTRLSGLAMTEYMPLGRDMNNMGLRPQTALDRAPGFKGEFNLGRGPDADFALSMRDSLKGIVGQLPQVILGAIQGGGSVTGAIGGAIGGGLLGAGTKLGDTITKGLSGALGKTLGGALGAAMPVVGSLLGAGLGKLFGGLFGGGPSKAEKEAQKQQALEKALPQLDSIMQKIDELLERTLKAGASGLADVFTWMGGQADMTSERLNRMGVVGMAMFGALRAQGMSTLEALRLMGPAIQAAIKAAEDSGTALTGPFATLADFYQKVEDNKGLVAAIDGLAAAMEALALTGQLNADTFAAMQAEAQSMFDQLIAQGFTAEQALAVMAPLLFAISEAAERYGFALDEATKAQIDQAKSMGLFENMKSPMETLVELQGEMLKVVAALAQYFGAVLPDSVQKYIDKLNKVPQPPGPPGQNGGEAPPEPMETPGSVPGYASGGYIPATPGGRVVRVSEGGEGEYIVPESQMARPGSLTVHYAPNVSVSGVRVESADEVAQKVQEVLQQERTQLPGTLREVMRDEMRAQGVL